MATPTLIDNVHTLSTRIGREIKAVKQTQVKHTAATAVGSATQGVFIASDGTATAMSFVLEQSVSSSAKLTDTLATVSETGTGNAVTALSASNGAITATKGETFIPSSGGTFTGNVTTLGSFGTPVAVSGTSIDLSLGTVFTKTISAATTFSFTNALSSKSSCFSLILTNGGSKTITWPSSVKWAKGEAPDLTSSGTDVLTFLTADGGSTWFGVPSSLAVA